MNTSLKAIFQEHIHLYPLLQPQDAVKLAYQSAFGGGHLIADMTRAAAYLHEERKTVTVSSIPLYEVIGNDMVRLHLSSNACAALPDDLILRVFAASAKRILQRGDNHARFDTALSALHALCAAGQTPFSADALDAYLKEYCAAGCPRVSHTEEYRCAYHPAYRVMEQSYIPLFPVIQAIDVLLSSNPNRDIVVAIDGCAAAGKTTAADALAALYDCNLFRMDDYFLPFEKRTPARLSEPGGNVDYERFQAEVLDGIASKKPFTRAAFDCSNGTLLPPVTVQPKRLSIVEGSYAHHPYFGDAYDLRIAVSVDAEEQRKRILRRNGEAMLAMFTSRWIPMENAYFEAFRIFEHADILL